MESAPFWGTQAGRHQRDCVCRLNLHKGLPELGKPAGPLPLAKLVECLQKLGGVGEAQLTFRRHMPTQVSHTQRILSTGQYNL